MTIKQNIKQEEFNLSEKIKEKSFLSNLEKSDILRIEDVKEFIKRLKEEITKGCMGTSANCYLIKKEIDKLAGLKLL